MSDEKIENIHEYMNYVLANASVVKRQAIALAELEYMEDNKHEQRTEF